MALFLRTCRRLSLIGHQTGTILFNRRLTTVPVSTTISFPNGIVPVNSRPPLPRQLPSINSTSIPATLPAPFTSSKLITIIDKCSLYDDHLYYDCPSLTNETMKCAWTSTNYRYRRQRRVRNHPSRLSNTRKYRSRRMRLHHKKKWLKKYKYDLLKRLREKIRRRGKLFEMENTLILGKAEQFNAENYIKRELEKAKFYGYRVSPVYDQIRQDIDRLKLE